MYIINIDLFSTPTGKLHQDSGLTSMIFPRPDGFSGGDEFDIQNYILDAGGEEEEVTLPYSPGPGCFGMRQRSSFHYSYCYCYCYSPSTRFLIGIPRGVCPLEQVLYE